MAMVQSWLTMTEQGHARRITVNFWMYEGVAFCDLGKMVWISMTLHEKRDDAWKEKSRYKHTKKTKEFFMHYKAGTKARRGRSADCTM